MAGAVLENCKKSEIWVMAREADCQPLAFDELF